MDKFNFSLILFGIIGIQVLSCKDDNIIDWQELQINNTNSSQCGCNLTVVNQYEELQTIITSSTNSLIWENDTMTAIVFNKDSAFCYLIKKKYNIKSICKICNYPPEIEDWDYSNNKIYNVKISGKTLETCNPTVNSTNNINADFILFKIYKEI